MLQFFSRHHKTVSLRACVAGVALATLGGCMSPAGRFVWVDQLSAAQRGSGQAGYIVGTNDMLQLLVFDHPEMSGKSKVRSDGNVSIALLGDVPAVGKEPAVLARDIEKQLAARNLVMGPHVTVVLDESAPVRVTVMGEVARPGLYALDAGAGMSEALASSGGLTEFAHRDRLYLVRKTPEVLRVRFSFADLAHGTGEAALFRLRSGDAIVVE